MNKFADKTTTAKILSTKIMLLQLGKKLVTEANQRLDQFNVPDSIRYKIVHPITEANSALADCLNAICERLLKAENSEQLIQVAKAIDILTQEKAIVVEISHWQEIQEAIATKNARIEELEKEVKQLKRKKA